MDRSGHRRPTLAATLAGVLALAGASAGVLPARAQDGFSACLAGLNAEAMRRGVGPDVVRQASAGLTPNTGLLRLLDHQPEFTRQPWEYINGAVTASRVAEGRRMLQTHRAAFERAERETGVDRHVIAAIWGMETSYGRAKGTSSVIRATATLACLGRRQDFFRGEYVAALQIVGAGHVTPDRFVGSWAGAFGHTQFMPSTFLRAARSAGGGPRIDLMNSPADAIMSTGNLLRLEGWRPGEGWGYEVTVPQGFDFRLAGRDRPLAIAEWQRRGIARVGGRPFPRGSDQAFLHLPAGARGPAFLMLPNFRTIMKYNNSENYAMAVGHLADRLRGFGAFVRPWPTTERALSQEERFELQRRLQQVGFYTGTVDGKLGAGTREALQRFQASAGMAADGFATSAVLRRLRGGG